MMGMAQIFGSIEFWSLFMIVIFGLITGWLIDDYRLVSLGSIVLLVFFTSSGMLPIWLGILVLVILSLATALILMEILLPASGGGGS